MASARAGRKKQQARSRAVTGQPVNIRRIPVQTNRFSPPSNEKVIVKKKRKSKGVAEGEGEGSRVSKKGRQAGELETPISEHSIPISEHSNRVMLGQLDINKRFPKTYMARRPVKKAPIGNTTISSLWHAVSPPHLPPTDVHARARAGARAGNPGGQACT